MTRVDGDFVGHHERGLKTHTELTNQLSVDRAVIFFELAYKIHRAGRGYGTNLAHQVIAAHTDPCIGQNQGVGVLVKLDIDTPLCVGVYHIAIRKHAEADLVQRIGRIGNQFSKEYFLVGIERMNDEVKQLLHLGPKFKGFGGGLLGL